MSVCVCVCVCVIYYCEIWKDTEFVSFFIIVVQLVQFKAIAYILYYSTLVKKMVGGGLCWDISTDIMLVNTLCLKPHQFCLWWAGWIYYCGCGKMGDFVVFLMVRSVRFRFDAIAIKVFYNYYSYFIILGRVTGSGMSCFMSLHVHAFMSLSFF